jgi:threonine synthase
MEWKGVIEHYREYLPVGDNTPIISLKEGNTPLIKAKNIKLEPLEIYFKYEGLNPTGSFKDRGMTLAISKAKEKGKKVALCASTGNTAASAAAYATLANMLLFIIVPEGAVAYPKLAQAVIHGARIIKVKGNFDLALEIVRKIGNLLDVEVVNSINPNRIEGQKTAAFEICDSLDDAPDYLAIPVGNAGNITAYWRGFKEYYNRGKTKKLPIMLGFQAEGASPIVQGRVIESPKTIATAIRIGNPASWQGALEARDESKGQIAAVSDEEIINAHSIIAEKEGLFVEPASAASLAGVIKKHKEGYFKSAKKGATLVCILTGHGLKDVEFVLNRIKREEISISSAEEAISKISTLTKNLTYTN